MARRTEPGKTVTLRFRVEKSQIAYVRFVLEGYEGLAIQSSDPKSSLISWEVPASLLDEALRVAAALRAETGLELLEQKNPTDRS
jgi:hypothetical protein